jgi:hypothetical protein
MTTPGTGHETGETGEDTPALDALADKVDKLADTVASLVDKVHGKAAEHEAGKLDRPTRTAETAQQHAASLADEVQAELAKLRKQEAADAEHAALTAKVGKLERAAERPPREYRRVERAMGWVRDDDR